jgi:hypothetical protein
LETGQVGFSKSPRDLEGTVERAYYSVPYQYIGKTLQVYISGSQVEIYDQYTLVATHQKASRDWEAVVSREHNPPNVEAFLASTREGLLKSAGRIGPHVTGGNPASSTT